jgi:hypothetical protein
MNWLDFLTLDKRGKMYFGILSAILTAIILEYFLLSTLPPIWTRSCCDPTSVSMCDTLKNMPVPEFSDYNKMTSQEICDMIQNYYENFRNVCYLLMALILAFSYLLVCYVSWRYKNKALKK